MDTKDASFRQLGQVFQRALSSCTGRELTLHTYPGPQNTASGFRAEVPMEGWTAGFFFWHHPQGLKGIFHLLECRVRFPGVRDMVFPFYSVLHQVAPGDFRCCCLSQISTEGEMTASVQWLWSVVSSRRAEITALASDPAPLVRRQREELSQYYQEDIFSACSRVTSRPGSSPGWRETARKRLHMQLTNWYARFHARLTGPTYASFLTGQFRQALEGFREGGPLNEYESALAAYMTSHDTLEEQVLPQALQGMMVNHQNQVPAPKAQGASRPAVSNSFILSNALLGALIQLPFWALFFALIYWLDCHWAGQGMAAVLGHRWEDPIFGAFLVSFSTSFLLLPEVIRRRYRNAPDKEQKLAVAEHYRAPRILWLFQSFRSAAVTLTTIYLFFSAYTGLAFTQSGFYDRSAFGSLSGVYYPYSQVECLRYDGEDYEIVLSTGDTLLPGEDFGISASKFQQTALPLFEAAGVPLEKEG